MSYHILYMSILAPIEINSIYNSPAISSDFVNIQTVIITILERTKAIKNKNASLLNELPRAENSKASPNVPIFAYAGVVVFGANALPIPPNTSGIGGVYP